MSRWGFVVSAAKNMLSEAKATYAARVFRRRCIFTHDYDILLRSKRGRGWLMGKAGAVALVKVGEIREQDDENIG